MGLARVDKSNPDACPKVALFNKGYLTQDFSKTPQTQDNAEIFWVSCNDFWKLSHRGLG